MSGSDIAQMAHLMRRAGFGATRDELERYVAQGYEAVVEELLHPAEAPPALEEEDVIRRYHVGQNNLLLLDSCQAYWLYRMINTRRPLEEKVALFWHGVFATAYFKLNQPKAILNQVEMFRRYGMGSFQTLLVQISRDPAMIFWLDNKDNHRDEPNENFGRELLELFSMGVGNYTEQDVFEASRAFTGWTIHNAGLHAARVSRDSVWPFGRLDWQFEYRDEDHDDTETSFLGHTGNFNGEDVIDIICRQEATARFLCRHLYNFFVADEAQVPAWETVPPRDPRAIQTMMDAYFDSGYEVRSVLRVMFNSGFFKDAVFQKIKSPTELIVGTARMAGGYRFPGLEDSDLAVKALYMGQSLLNPPSVEGWHTGVEWIYTGSLVDRVNFAVGELSAEDRPGVQAIIDNVGSTGDILSPGELVDRCLDLLGPVEASGATRDELVAHAAEGGTVKFGPDASNGASAQRVRELLQMIVSTREYQLA